MTNEFITVKTGRVIHTHDGPIVVEYSASNRLTTITPSRSPLILTVEELDQLLNQLQKIHKLASTEQP